uniref:WWC1-like helical hairpin domain-containing protein n=1 Tax=Myripristis murdjan TaxID=586833 RepID=A0A667YMN3_9TELE
MIIAFSPLCFLFLPLTFAPHPSSSCPSRLPRIATIEVQIAKLDSEAWPGLLDPERDRLILINEKEELLKELQYVRPSRRMEPNDAEKLESQKKRLERDLQAARDNQSKALTERWVGHRLETTGTHTHTHTHRERERERERERNKTILNSVQFSQIEDHILLLNI